MLVSIIMPTYNSSVYIDAAIKSILKQTYDNWELLITDDCSSDDTWQRLKEYAARDSRIKIFQLDKNSGAGVARNNSIKHGSGRFIAFCDSDDQWKPNKLEKQLPFMIEHGLALSFSSYDLVDERGNYLGNINAPPKVDYKTMLKNNYIGCLTAMYDIDKIGKIFMPEIRKRQDWALWLAILKKVPYAMGINENLATYRMRVESISSGKISLIKYNWNVYRNVEQFSIIKSLYSIIIFIVYYLIKKVANE